ncbi:hypothetical protein SAE01_46600 [Segetibacter aerophilus]|uniref:Uncharacterized protein n=2 Tax=Segetibacter aerophilus TaxID=670293 RepID=A0A512BJN8_9BACT|nr:hypothetical protein SAE01_46600 [Segetibacter aerophilus]
MLVEKGTIAINTRAGFIGTTTFVAGVIINEVFLTFQGISALFGLYPQRLPILLLANTIVMASGALLVFIASVKTIKSINYSLHLNTKPLKITSWKL